MVWACSVARLVALGFLEVAGFGVGDSDLGVRILLVGG